MQTDEMRLSGDTIDNTKYEYMEGTKIQLLRALFIRAFPGHYACWYLFPNLTYSTFVCNYHFTILQMFY